MAKEVTRADLQRLWKDWRTQADKAERLQGDPQGDRVEKRLLAMQGRTLDVCIADLRDLLDDKPHPSGRRGSDR